MVNVSDVQSALKKGCQAAENLLVHVKASDVLALITELERLQATATAIVQPHDSPAACDAP